MTNQRPSRLALLRVLLFGGHWEFVSPLSLEECVERFQARAERKFGFMGLFPVERIDMMMIDDDTYMFKVVAKFSRGPSFASAYALLDRHEVETTAIEIETRTSLLMYIPLAGMVVLMAIGPFIGDTSRYMSLRIGYPAWVSCAPQSLSYGW